MKKVIPLLFLALGFVSIPAFATAPAPDALASAPDSVAPSSSAMISASAPAPDALVSAPAPLFGVAVAQVDFKDSGMIARDMLGGRVAI